MNAIQSSMIASTGVVISQIISSSSEKFVLNWLEIRVMAMIVAFFNTPILLWFFKFLSTSKMGIFAQLLLDQFIFSPPFSAGIITLRFIFINGIPLSGILSQLITVLPKAMMTSWMFWIPCRFLMLIYVPAHLQLLVVNMCALVWNVIFALILK